MKKHNTYIVIDEKFSDGTMFASVEKIGNCDNLLCFVERFPDAYAMNVCATRKEAREIADFWNDRHKANGNITRWQHLYAR